MSEFAYPGYTIEESGFEHVTAPSFLTRYIDAMPFLHSTLMPATAPYNVGVSPSDDKKPNRYFDDETIERNRQTAWGYLTELLSKNKEEA